MAKKLTDLKPKPKGRPKEAVSDKVDFEQLTMLCEKGFTDTELAEFYKVHRKTIHNWKQDEVFIAHLKKGKEVSDAKVERSLFERAVGYSHPEDIIFNNKGVEMVVATTKHYPPDPVSCIFWLKNRKPEDWRDKREMDINDSTIKVKFEE